MVTDRFTWIYKCDTVHVIVAWGGVYREKLDIDSAKLILQSPVLILTTLRKEF